MSKVVARQSVAAAILVIAAATPRLLPAQRSLVYPMWFVQPTAGDPGSTVAVGMAQKYVTLSTSIAEATTAAHRGVLLSRRSRVRVDMLMQTVGSAKERRGESYEETPLADSSGIKFVELDTAVVGDVVMVLSGTSSSIPVDRTLVGLSTTPPAWVTTPPRADGSLNVVGSAPVYFYEHNSWVEAEARARRAAAFEFTSTSRDLFRTDRTEVGKDVSGVSSMSTDAVLDHAVIVARWRDKRVAYVLLRVESASRGTPQP